MIFDESLLENATSYILAAMGGLIALRAGVVNIALEAHMLVGALVAVLCAAAFDNAYLGLLCALLLGAATAGVLAYFHLQLKADIILVGVALLLAAQGGTVLALYGVTGQSGNSSTLDHPSLPPIKLEFLDGVPILNLIANQSAITWVALASLPAALWFFKQTALGVHVVAAGQNELALVEAGVSVHRVRWFALISSGALAGIAGAQLSTATTSDFSRDMTQGRGFIALGAIYLGRERPGGTFLAAVAFGAFDSLATVMQVRTGISPELINTLPYVTALVVFGATAWYTHTRTGTAKRRKAT